MGLLYMGEIYQPARQSNWDLVAFSTMREEERGKKEKRKSKKSQLGKRQ